MYKTYRPFDPFTPFDANSMLRQGIITVANAAERGQIETPTEGMRVYRLDTHRDERFDGVTWVDVNPITQISAVERNVNSPQGGIGTALVELLDLSLPITLITPIRVRILASINTYSASAGDVIKVAIRDDTTTLREYTRAANSSPSSAGTTNNQSIIANNIPLGQGAHRINIAIARVAGSGAVTSFTNDLNPSILSVDRI